MKIIFGNDCLSYSSKNGLSLIRSLRAVNTKCVDRCSEEGNLQIGFEFPLYLLCAYVLLEGNDEYQLLIDLPEWSSEMYFLLCPELKQDNKQATSIFTF